MPVFEEMLREEMEGLRQQLQSNPLFVKYEQVRETARLYGVEPDGGSPSPRPQKKPAYYTGRGTGKINRGANPDRDRALALAAEVLRGRSMPMKTAEIYDLILPMGAKIGGTEPKSNLSAMLHHSATFKSHGRKGWTLTSESDVEMPPQFGEWDDPDESPGAPEADDEGELEDLLD